MQNIKVQITKTYCIDVIAKDNIEALELAKPILDQKMRNGTDHYFETVEPDYIFFDVTNTEDPFNPDN